MKVGTKAQGQTPNGKWCVNRHSSQGTKRGANACEKAIETVVRQGAKKAIRDYSKEY